MKPRFANFCSLIFRTIRNGLIMVLPILFIGSFSVLLVYFPIPAYQNFISTFLGGTIQHLLFMVLISAWTIRAYSTFSTISLIWSSWTEIL
ncbi:MAG: hypothetical protein IJP61_10770 [Treponema sp.]|nr:hypothetical protein [Treponema sp.]